jgi:hypothetical protein
MRAIWLLVVVLRQLEGRLVLERFWSDVRDAANAVVQVRARLPPRQNIVGIKRRPTRSEH